ncbi:MAG: tRNA (guanosine(46)-N7)-methyltransferase TrmB [Negativicutes bacterium]|jgi:tRNA (guanine-N7-)-methyltransferase
MKERIKDFYGDGIIDDFSLDSTAVFLKNKPLWLEIGTGMGRFINGMAFLYPQVNFLGVERVTGVVYRAVEAARQQEIGNLWFVNRDVSDVFDWLGMQSVEKIFLNFSDPWPKNRHEKKRLTHQKLLKQYQKLLVKGGEIVFKTDNEELFAWSLEQFAAMNMNLNFLSYDWHNAPEYLEAADVMTEYEERFSGLGKRILRVVADFESVNCENLA